MQKENENHFHEGLRTKFVFLRCGLFEWRGVREVAPYNDEGMAGGETPPLRRRKNGGTVVGEGLAPPVPPSDEGGGFAKGKDGGRENAFREANE